jgi:lysophosphatidate acyltransferase
MDPIPTTGLTSADVDSLTKKTYDAMLEEYIRLTAKAQGRPIAAPVASEPTKAVSASGADATAI